MFECIFVKIDYFILLLYTYTFTIYTFTMSDLRFDIVRNLLDLKANIDKKDDFDRTMLHRATIDGDIDMVKFLLSCKADINARDIGGFTPFHYMKKK